ncbi:hypothetical protein [Streptomyces niger]|nr:hypothetical protein [Streptomyces niger]
MSSPLLHIAASASQEPTQRRPDRAPTRPPNKPAHRDEQLR